MNVWMLLGLIIAAEIGCSVLSARMRSRPGAPKPHTRKDAMRTEFWI